MTDANNLIEALIDLPLISDPQLNPTGDRVAFVRSRSFKADKDTPATGAVYVIDRNPASTSAFSPIRLFAGDDHSFSGSPRWSPDGHYLGFTSDRANRREAQIYLMRAYGGEAVQLTDLRGRVRSPIWMPDNQAITFLSNGIQAESALESPDPKVLDRDLPFMRVWSTGLTPNTMRPITPSDLNVFEYALSPDGHWLALIAANEATNEAWYYAQIYITEIATGNTRQLCRTVDQIGRPAFSPDGTQLAFIQDILSDEGGIAGDVYVVPISTASADANVPRLLTSNSDHSPLWLNWLPEGILYGARQQTGSRLGWLDPLTGTNRPIVRRADSIGGRREQQISQAADGRTFATLIDGFDAPPELFLGDLIDGTLHQITHLHTDPPGVRTRVESITWPSADGQEIQGYLSYPVDYQPGQRCPLIVVAHGGPSSSHEPSYGSTAWAGWRHWAISRGCAILMPNPRGSWGRGHAFQAANVGDLGGGDWQDIISGVDYLIAQGLADPDRLAIAGWSYGGYLTAWAVSQTDRFKCAIAGAAITNNESNYGVVSIRGWQAALYGSTPYEEAALHRSRSPLAHVHKVKTPVLLLHGEADDDVPVEQSIEFYTALKHFKVTTECVIYPREPHAFQEKAHQRDMATRIVGWLTRYLDLK